jgi:hypothetical protein
MEELDSRVEKKLCENKTNTGRIVECSWWLPRMDLMPLVCCPSYAPPVGFSNELGDTKDKILCFSSGSV